MGAVDDLKPRERITWRIAQELKDGDVVNLGIGMPTGVANFIPEGVEVILQSENGFVGTGSTPNEGEEDPDLVNAGAQFVTTLPGACFFDSATSFGIIRGGHVDATVLGTLEVDQEGNIANYIIPGKMVPGMGGAMDLCTGAKKVFVATDHCDRKGNSKILKKCNLPLTAAKQADYIVTELAFMEVTSEGLVVREIAPGISVEELKEKTDADLIIPADVKMIG